MKEEDYENYKNYDNYDAYISYPNRMNILLRHYKDEIVELSKEISLIEDNEQKLNEILETISQKIQEFKSLLEESASLGTLDDKKQEIGVEFSSLAHLLWDTKGKLKQYKDLSRSYKEQKKDIAHLAQEPFEYANEVEQGIMTLLNDKYWNNKAFTICFWKSCVPENIKKMKSILMNSTLSHQSKIIEIKNIVTAQAVKGKLSRHRHVQQLYQGLSDMFKQHYPYTTNSEQQYLSDFIRYDETNSAEINQTIAAVAQGLKLNHSEPVSSFAAASSL